jgi:hypothetical protein
VKIVDEDTLAYIKYLEDDNEMKDFKIKVNLIWFENFRTFQKK